MTLEINPSVFGLLEIFSSAQVCLILWILTSQTKFSPLNLVNIDRCIRNFKITCKKPFFISLSSKYFFYIYTDKDIELLLLISITSQLPYTYILIDTI